MVHSKHAVVFGAAGFIGTHLVSHLKSQGLHVRGVDRVAPQFGASDADDFIIGDLRDLTVMRDALSGPVDEVYQLAAEMGGAGYIFTAENDFEIVMNSARVNMNTVQLCAELGIPRVLFTSSACVYNQLLQTTDGNFRCREQDAYPAFPDSEYGWEKLFSERIFALLDKHRKTQARVARLHNVFGPKGTWQGGREKAPAAICRKVAEAQSGDTVEIWGDGSQIRSFLYVDDCLNGLTTLMRSDQTGPFNIGSEEFISIMDLMKMAIEISGKSLQIRCIPGPIGVGARSSDNTIVTDAIGWQPSTSLRDGMQRTYTWIAGQVAANQATATA